MRKVLGLLLAAALAAPAVAETASLTHVIVMFRAQIPDDLNATLAQEGASIVQLDAELAFIVAGTTTPAGFIERMRLRQDVEHAYGPNAGAVDVAAYCTLADVSGPFACSTTILPSGSAPPPSESPTPNDPAYYQICGSLPCQWGLRVVNRTTSWNVTLGSPSVTVAVLDTGVTETHPDLLENLKQVGLHRGLNVVEPGTPPTDRHGHGTLVAGILGGVVNNNFGMAGVARSTILAVKVCHDNGVCLPQHVAPGIVQARSHGANVISMSFGLPYDPLVERAVNLSSQRGALLVASVGNGNQRFVHFPASLPDVMAVSGVNATRTFAMSNYGSQVEIAAPAGSGTRDERDVFTTTPNGHFGFAHGTSMAAPHVSGVAALLKSLHPEWSAGQVRAHLRATAAPVGESPNERYGHGILDADRAVFEADSLRLSLDYGARRERDT